MYGKHGKCKGIVWEVYWKYWKGIGRMSIVWEVWEVHVKCMGSVWKGLEVYEKYGKNQKCILSYLNYGKCIRSMGSVWGCN